MKTLNLAIIVGSGITIAIIFSVLYFFPSQVLSGTTESPGAVNLDLSNSTTENPLGIKAQIVMEVDRAIMCPTKCVIPPTPHLVLTSDEGAQFVGYQVCNGTSCKKDNLGNSLYVHLAQVPQNYSGTVGLEASHINLGNLPWSVGDRVHILVKAFPVTLQTNNVVIREPEKTMVIDLGEVIIENYTTTNVSTIIIPKDSENPNSGKSYEPDSLVVVLGVNNTVSWINQAVVGNVIVADNSSDPSFAAAAPYHEGQTSDTKFLSDLYAGTAYVEQVLQPDGKRTILYNATSKSENFLQPGKSFEYTFTTPGSFGYHGRPWQRGSVTVLPPVCSQPPQTIEPGGFGVRSCPMPYVVMDSTVFFSSDFDGIYHKSDGSELDDYVLQRGHNGTITYLINATGRASYSDGQIAPPTVNLTNYAQIFYQVKLGENGFGYATPDGIHITYDPTSETLGVGDVQVVTATISIDKNAPLGTYWVILSPGHCNGGPILLLTVGDCPYSEMQK